MKILIACEFSGIIREAFAKLGHDAWSCDLLDTEIPGKHIIGDVELVLNKGWDLMIAHPPCTHLAVSGARYFKYKRKEQQQALDFVSLLMNAPINKICIENPVSIISTRIRKPDQIIHPWQFGHQENKKTCLWLKNLPLLTETNNVRQNMCFLPNKISNRIHYASPSKDRWKLRSRTYQGIANAMAKQWSN